MDYWSAESRQCISSNGTPCHIHSPLPVRTPRLGNLSLVAAMQKIDADEQTTKSRANAQSDKSISKRFFDLAKEDLDSEPR